MVGFFMILGEIIYAILKGIVEVIYMTIDFFQSIRQIINFIDSKVIRGDNYEITCSS